MPAVLPSDRAKGIRIWTGKTIVGHTRSHPAKQRQALRERNLPRNSRRQTHPDEEIPGRSQTLAVPGINQRPYRRIDLLCLKKLIKKFAAQRLPYFVTGGVTKSLNS
jgi:hypothetical protein